MLLFTSCTSTKQAGNLSYADVSLNFSSEEFEVISLEPVSASAKSFFGISENVNESSILDRSEFNTESGATWGLLTMAAAVPSAIVAGVLAGETLNSPSHIRIDQGLNTTEIPPTFTIDSDLAETAYIIEIDNRLGRIAHPTKTSLADPSFIDDDSIASYYLTLNDSGYVSSNESTSTSTQDNTQVIRGPRGTILKFRIQASLELNTSTYLFDLIGGSGTVTIKRQTDDGPSNSSFTNYIDTIVRVTGATTGYSIDIPVRLVKKA